MSDARLRALEHRVFSDLANASQVELRELDALYDRLGRWQDSRRMWFQWRQSLPPLPVVVRRHPEWGFIVFFLTIPGGARVGEMEAYDNHGSFSADYHALLSVTTPVRPPLPEAAARLVRQLENLDGRRLKVVQRNSYKYDKERLDAYYGRSR